MADKIIQVICIMCGEPLNQPGALVFTPPTATPSRAEQTCRKLHVCSECFGNKGGLLEFLTQRLCVKKEPGQLFVVQYPNGVASGYALVMANSAAEAKEKLCAVLSGPYQFDGDPAHIQVRTPRFGRDIDLIYDGYP